MKKQTIDFKMLPKAIKMYPTTWNSLSYEPLNIVALSFDKNGFVNGFLDESLFSVTANDCARFDSEFDCFSTSRPTNDHLKTLNYNIGIEKKAAKNGDKLSKDFAERLIEFRKSMKKQMR